MKTVWDNVDMFEKMVAEYSGAQYGVAVDSCTNAIFLSLLYCKKQQPSVQTIDVPKKTYISVPIQVKHAGMNVNFTDDAWSGVYQLKPFNIYDSAQRFTKGMYRKNSLYCVSFNFKKIVSTGRGGMILTDSEDAYKWLRKMRYDGRDSIFYNDIEKTDITELGYHMYMTPEQAIRGINEMYRIDTCNPDKARYNDYKIDLSLLKVFNEK